jgi:hypothetical protein
VQSGSPAHRRTHLSASALRSPSGGTRLSYASLPSCRAPTAGHAGRGRRLGRRAAVCAAVSAGRPGRSPRSHESAGLLRSPCSKLEIPLCKEQHLSRIQQVIETLESERAEVQKHLAWLEQQINEFHAQRPQWRLGIGHSGSLGAPRDGKAREQAACNRAQPSARRQVAHHRLPRPAAWQHRR